MAQQQRQELQPDFGEMAQCFDSLGVQMQRCVNLPAVRGGDDILHALRELQEAVAEMRRSQAEMLAMLNAMRVRGYAR